MTRKNCPSDITDGEWAFVTPYLKLMTQQAPQRHHSLRELFDSLQRLARSGAQWRMLPEDFPPRSAAYQQFSISAIPALDEGAMLQTYGS